MTNNPSVPQRLQGDARIRELEKRVDLLERAPRLTSSSITGQLKLLDANGAVLFQVSTDTGFDRPWLHTGWWDPDVNKNVTSATWVVAWRTSIELVFGIGILFRFNHTVPVGTTAQFRLKLLGGGVVGAVKTVVGTGAPVATEFRGNHTLALSGGPIHFDLECQLTVGAGPVVIGRPTNMAHGITGGPTPASWVS